MKKITYLLSIAVVALCLYSFTFKKEMPLSSKIQADLAALKADLAANSDGASSGGTISTSDLRNARILFNNSRGYSSRDSSHCGIIGINDIITMLTENDGSTINNSIVVYPIVTSSGEHSVAFAGAQLSGDKSMISVSSRANHYLSSWCPSICPKSADAIIGGGK